MKIYVSLFCILASIGLIAQPSEEVAIKRVIEEETEAAYARDHDEWAKHWFKDHAFFHYVSEEAQTLEENWAAIDAAMQPAFEGEPVEDAPIRKNFQAKIGGDLAWVTYDQFSGNTHTKEQRVLTKVGDTWKIMNMTAVDVGSYEKTGPIRRILYFSYKPDTPPEEIALVKAKFQDMVSLIEGMEAAVWMDTPDADASYNHSLLLVFEHEKAVQTYEAHPNHQVAIEKWQQFGDGSKIFGHSYQEN